MADVKLNTAAQLKLPARAVGRPSGPSGDTRFGTMRDAVEICDVTPHTIRKWLAAGMIAVTEKRGRSWRFDLAEIERLRDSEDLIWLNAHDR